MTQQHNFDAYEAYKDLIRRNPHLLNTIPMRLDKAIQAALRIADRVQSGEVCDER